MKASPFSPREKQPLPRGVIVPVVTPFDEAGDLDLPAYERLLRHVIAGGVDALFAVGTTGEGPSLSADEQRMLVRHTCEHAGSLPVYVGVTHASDRETLRLIDFARECGATAAVAAPPPYFPAGVREQVAYFETLANASSLPVILYNIPQLTKTAISLEAFNELVDHPCFLGIKDSSGQMTYFRRLQHVAARRDDFSLLIGADELMAEAVLLGADGGVTGGANLAPDLFSRLFRAALARDLDAVLVLQREVMELSCKLYAGGGGGYVIQGIKAVLHRRGICRPEVRLPLLTAGGVLGEAVQAADELLRRLVPPGLVVSSPA